MEIDPEEAGVVRELFLWTANKGYSSYTPAAMLKNRGLRTYSGALPQLAGYVWQAQAEIPTTTEYWIGRNIAENPSVHP